MVIPESNLAFESMHIADHLRDEFGEQRPGNYVVMNEDDARAGVRTNEDLKLAITTSFDMLLQKRLVKFHQNFFSVGEIVIMNLSAEDEANASAYLGHNLNGVNAGSTVGTMHDVLGGVSRSDIERRNMERQIMVRMGVNQQDMADKARDIVVQHMRNWTRVVRPRKDPTDLRAAQVFLTGKLGGEPDDDTMCLLLGNSFRKRFLTKDAYRQFRKNTVAS